ncbi:MurR/RpiR family transcriptional regulator [Klebsiella pneumoniae]|uniref:MurR/RpiR family transcriptional regulator n=1 Tax=Klebsiella pneumoniae TaxID=573 RepID=UPI001888339C|nr:MurR/RpiR family transcriptional regulator [Klebsiella pneumoniae]
MDIVGQLQEGMRRFSAQESRVATFILQNLSFTASASIDELAASAGVSPAHQRRASWLTPDSAALPVAWRDKLSSLGVTLTRQLGHTAEAAVEKCKSRLLSARAVHCFALGAQDVTLAALLQHQLLPSGIAINLCQDAALMRLTASTLNDDHLLLVLATAEANPVLQSATLQARTQGVTIIALTPEQHALGDMASAILPLPADPQQARYALLLLVDLLNDTLIA